MGMIETLKAAGNLAWFHDGVSTTGPRTCEAFQELALAIDGDQIANLRFLGGLTWGYEVGEGGHWMLVDITFGNCGCPKCKALKLLWKTAGKYTDRLNEKIRSMAYRPI